MDRPHVLCASPWAKGSCSEDKASKSRGGMSARSPTISASSTLSAPKDEAMLRRERRLSVLAEDPVST
ncbi:hypothetical protein B0H19DRAFT_1117181 [Mycena capillaripes]|nr:hypothetical protein B0H19DRAFT_1117181 [Mycena capillaripes]